MDQAPRKVFTEERRKIERASGRQDFPKTESTPQFELESVVEAAKNEIIQELQRSTAQLALRLAPKPMNTSDVQGQLNTVRADRDVLQAKLTHMIKVQAEVTSLTRIIDTTKREIAALYRAQGKGNRLDIVTDELDSVVQDTEIAAEDMTDIAENVDELTERLQANAMGSDSILEIADGISAQTTRLFEACNFQDLAGQRIGKVINTLQMLDERLSRLADFRHKDSSKVEPAVLDEHETDGPRQTKVGRSIEVETLTQDEADALASGDDFDGLFGD